jgi:hypothetical protein
MHSFSGIELQHRMAEQRKQSIPVLLCFIGLLMLLPVRLQAFANGDRQFWWQGTIEKTLSRNWALYLGNELRYGNEFSHLYLSRVDGGAIYRFNGWAECALGYKNFRKEKETNVWQTVYIPTIDWWFYVHGPFVSITWQNKFEFQNPSGEANFFLNRNKITLTSPRKWTSLHLQPFVAGEAFYYFNSHQVQIRRLFVGMHVSPPHSFFRTTLQYLENQSSTLAGWVTYHTLVIGLKLFL